MFIYEYVLIQIYVDLDIPIIIIIYASYIIIAFVFECISLYHYYQSFIYSHIIIVLIRSSPRLVSSRSNKPSHASQSVSASVDGGIFHGCVIALPVLIKRCLSSVFQWRI
jgi:hypothetical protein